MPRRTAVQEADMMLPKEVRGRLQETRQRMDANLAFERRAQENRELDEQRRRDRELVEGFIEEVTGEQIGNAGMTNSEMTRARMAKYTRTPVRRSEVERDSEEKAA